MRRSETRFYKMQLHTLDPSNNNVEIGAQQDFEWTEGELVHVTNEFWDYVAANQGHVPIPIQIDRFAFFVLQGLPVLNFCKYRVRGCNQSGCGPWSEFSLYGPGLPW